MKNTIRWKNSFEFHTEKVNGTRRLNIRGVAINAGLTRNRHFFSAGVLQGAASTMQGCTIFKNHSATVEDAIGRVTKSEFYDNAIHFEGFISNDADTISKINDGIIKNVSIGCLSEAEYNKKEDFYTIQSPMEIIELSLVGLPGDAGATVAIAESFQEAVTNKFNENNFIGIKSDEDKELKIQKEKLEVIKMENIKKLNDEVEVHREGKSLSMNIKPKSKVLKLEESELKKMDEDYDFDLGSDGKFSLSKKSY